MQKNEENLPKLNINWYPGHMAKTKRQVKEDLNLIDVVIELLDARIPVSSQNPDIKEITLNKKKIVVLNKSDLADERANKEWKTYFETRGIPTIIADSKSGKGIRRSSTKSSRSNETRARNTSIKRKKRKAN